MLLSDLVMNYNYYLLEKLLLTSKFIYITLDTKSKKLNIPEYLRLLDKLNITLNMTHSTSLDIKFNSIFFSFTLHDKINPYRYIVPWESLLSISENRPNTNVIPIKAKLTTKEQAKRLGLKLIKGGKL